MQGTSFCIETALIAAGLSPEEAATAIALRKQQEAGPAAPAAAGENEHVLCVKCFGDGSSRCYCRDGKDSSNSSSYALLMQLQSKFRSVCAFYEHLLCRGCDTDNQRCEEAQA
jgi:hypothetical protein